MMMMMAGMHIWQFESCPNIAREDYADTQIAQGSNAMTSHAILVTLLLIASAANEYCQGPSAEQHRNEARN